MSYMSVLGFYSICPVNLNNSWAYVYKLTLFQTLWLKIFFNLH